ncbi:MAG: zinc-ribbon domain-containing protein [Alphaproteobacteria bacterium]|nr:zinc-ribbon domain-containing protein [Alphaproteobacteria bacterium]
MIVSCPACLTQFKVDPALIGSDGRKVRCAKCAHVWRVGQDGTPISTGQFGLRAAPARAAEPAAPEPLSESQAAAKAVPAPGTPDETRESRPAPGEPSLRARELIEREQAAKPAAGSAEEAGSAGEAAQEGEAANAVKPGLATAADAGPGEAAAPAVPRAKPQKGGKKLKIFLLLLVFIVLALIAAAVMTGQFEPGGIGPGPQAPSTGDVAPPASDLGIPGSKPGRPEGSAAVIGGLN